MLPTQLRSGLVSTSSRSLSRPSGIALPSVLLLNAQCRSFWGWRRGCDWSSQLDPSYQRSQHVRSLKTRAKLRAILRRRGKFEWDVLHRPFFTSKHVRWASHWNGPGDKPQWPHQVYDENDQNKPVEVNISEEQGCELSHREKKWKDLMESLRKRIDRDPYEAVFGKRFDPFWNPLVPSWMKQVLAEEKVKEPNQQRQPAKAEVAPKAVRQDATAEDRTKTASSQPESSQSTKCKIDDKPSSYAYSSSTTWDSWSNRTKQTEWDSVSNQTRRFEYDPISNRMVQVNDSATGLQRLTVDEPSPVSTPTSGMKVSAAPPQTSNVSTSMQASSTERTSAKALQSLPKSDLDLLTADHIRASMGKLKDTSPPVKHERADLEAEFETKAQATDYEIDQILLSRGHTKPRSGSKHLQTSLNRSKATVVPFISTPLQSVIERLQSKKGVRSSEDADDSAAHESTEHAVNSSSTNLPKHWSEQAELLQADRVKRTALKKPFPMMPRWIDDMDARKAAYEAQQVPSVEEQARIAKKQKLLAILTNEVEQQKSLFSMHETKHAHKMSYQGLERKLVKYDRGGALQLSSTAADQRFNSVKISSSEKDKPVNKSAEDPRSIAGLEAKFVAQQAETKNGEERYRKKVRTLQAELDTAYKQSSEHSEMHLDHIRKLERELERFESSTGTKTAGGSLSVEIADEKTKLEQRYKQKLRMLQIELETAYKQSSKHSEMHMDQIRKLEQELEKVNKATRSESKSANKHSLESMRGEGDFCTNVVKYADSSKWYKRPALSPQQQQQREGQKLEQKERDQRIVREVRDIYEQAYGTIDAQHKQNVLQKALVMKPSIEHEVKKGDVAEALSSYEDKQSYGFEQDSLASELGKQKAKVDEVPSQQYRFKNDALANELKQQEKTSEEPVSLRYRFKGDGLANEIARQEQEAYEAIAANEQEAVLLSKQLPTSDVELQAEKSKPSQEMPAVEWQDPPTYKVLAYDTANDAFSTTTTTSNFSLSEQPISLPQALSQLNQPARFMPYFAELQREGFQVIYTTRNLLLFKQVKALPAPSSVKYTRQRTEHLNIHDHGLLRPYENAVAQEAAMYHDSSKAASTSEDPSSVEHGHNFGLTPPENLMAQEAARAYDIARRNTANPIDGTMIVNGVKPATGNFASPTDFVNHDPVTLPTRSAPARGDGEVIQYPKVKRQEPVFSGTLPPPPVPTFGRASSADSSSIQSKAMKRKWRRQFREEQLEWRRERQRRRRSGAGAIKWALSVGVLAAGTAYAIGTIAEKTRSKGVQNGQSKERWQEILEGKRGRWE